MAVMPMLCTALWFILYDLDKLEDNAIVFLMSFFSFLCLYVSWAVWFIFNPEKK